MARVAQCRRRRCQQGWPEGDTQCSVCAVHCTCALGEGGGKGFFLGGQGQTSSTPHHTTSHHTSPNATMTTAHLFPCHSTDQTSLL